MNTISAFLNKFQSYKRLNECVHANHKLFGSLDEDSVHISHILINLIITGKMQEVLLKTHDKSNV
jgi:hypothetical protein